MTVSQELVLYKLLNQDTFNINDIGFILTVIRDNCLDDDLYDYIQFLLDELWERCFN